jgi:hypothetical protein
MAVFAGTGFDTGQRRELGYAGFSKGNLDRSLRARLSTVKITRVM